jgi:hypothetical protein
MGVVEGFVERWRAWTAVMARAMARDLDAGSIGIA